MKRKIKIISSFPILIWEYFITYLPGNIGFILRRKFWAKRLKKMGNNVKIDVGVYFQNPEYIIINNNCWIDRNVIILAGIDNSDREKIILKNRNFKEEAGTVYIGENVHIGPFSILSGISAGIHISDDCGISSGCKLYSFSHHYKSKKQPSEKNIHFGPMVSDDRQCLIEGAITLSRNTGLALNTIVLPGVHIPEDCFISINSVVHRRKFLANSLIAGNPAIKISERF